MSQILGLYIHAQTPSTIIIVRKVGIGSGLIK